MSNFFSEFIVKEDVDLRYGIRKFYSEVVYNDNLEKPIVIKLPETKWISAYGLNMLITCIEAFRLKNKRVKIYLILFDQRTIDKILSLYPDNEQLELVDEDKELVDKITKKIIFYEAMEFTNVLRYCKVIMKPSCTIFLKLQEKMKAFKSKGFYKYSSKMLPLSPLIESEDEQHALTTRMKTMTNILYHNLYGRIDLDIAFEAAGQIMFELVKNIYQHSDLDLQSENFARGYACAQINLHPIITVSPKEIITSTLEHLKPRIKSKKWMYLSISVSDFGTGITEKVRSELFDRFKKIKKEYQIGRHVINKKTFNDAKKIVEIAVTSDFSTKKVRRKKDDIWKAGNKIIKLEDKGYGLVYCMSFIARLFGKMQITSGGVQVDIEVTPEAPFEKELWLNTKQASELTEKMFNNYYIIKQKKIPHEIEGRCFPGTQILIEVPVESF